MPWFDKLTTRVAHIGQVNLNRKTLENFRWRLTKAPARLPHPMHRLRLRGGTLLICWIALCRVDVSALVLAAR
jgi:hypothetical protein